MMPKKESKTLNNHPSMNPHILAENRMQLSAEFSKYSGELAILIKEQADYFNLHRPEHKSDTSLKRSWEATDRGVRMTITKLKLAALKVEMSSIKTMIDVATEEARGLY